MYCKLGRQSRQAYGLTADIVERLIAATSDDLRGMRDRALLRLAYESMRRRMELTSLRIEDIAWQGDGSAVILLRKSKTDQEGQGKWIFATGTIAACLRQWIESAGITTGFVIRGISKWGQVTPGIHPGYIPFIYKSLAKQAGLDACAISTISGHSPRVGCAQDLMRAGASLPQIMVRGGWTKTDTVMRHIEKIHRQ